MAQGKTVAPKRAAIRLIQSFNFWFSVKIDQTQFIGMLDIFQRDGTKTIFLSLYFLESHQDINIGINIILDQGSPQVRSDDVRACKCNVWNNVYSIWRFSRECNTSFQVLAGANRALVWKNHVQAPCKFSFSTSASWAEKICKSSKVKTFSIQQANFWKEWTWLRYLHISHEAISVGNSPRVQT